MRRILKIIFHYLKFKRDIQKQNKFLEPTTQEEEDEKDEKPVLEPEAAKPAEKKAMKVEKKNEDFG